LGWFASLAIIFGFYAFLTRGPHISTIKSVALVFGVSIFVAAASTFARWFMGFMPESELPETEPPDIDPADRVRKSN
jgi:hypothetical protein